jgi:poly(3-hydroxybutyrate) depolymerase
MTPTRRALLAGLLATPLGCGSSVRRAEPGSHELEDRIRGKRRMSTLLIPEGLEGPAPMVVGLHDTGSGAAHLMEACGWRTMLASRGWIGLFPTYEKGDLRDDNTYLAHVLQRATATAGGDPKHVFVVGHGAGGRRAYALAVKSATLLTAVGTCSAVVRFQAEHLGFQNPAGASVSVIHIHGGADVRVPVAGGPLEGRDKVMRQVSPLDEALRPWVERIKGTPEAAELDLPERIDVARWAAGGREVLRLIDPRQDHTYNLDYATRIFAERFALAPARQIRDK